MHIISHEDLKTIYINTNLHTWFVINFSNTARNSRISDFISYLHTIKIYTNNHWPVLKTIFHHRVSKFLICFNILSQIIRVGCLHLIPLFNSWKVTAPLASTHAHYQCTSPHPAPPVLRVMELWLFFAFLLPGVTTRTSTTECLSVPTEVWSPQGWKH